MAGPGGRTVAGRAAGVRAMANGVRAVSALAAGWHLGAGADRPAGAGGRSRADHLGCERGFHGGAGASARSLGAENIGAGPPLHVHDREDESFYVLLIAVPGGIEDYFAQINAASSDDERHLIGECYGIRVVPG
jgi:hypothetical protein